MLHVIRKNLHLFLNKIGGPWSGNECNIRYCSFYPRSLDYLKLKRPCFTERDSDGTYRCKFYKLTNYSPYLRDTKSKNCFRLWIVFGNKLQFHDEMVHDCRRLNTGGKIGIHSNMEDGQQYRTDGQVSTNSGQVNHVPKHNLDSQLWVGRRWWGKFLRGQQVLDVDTQINCWRGRQGLHPVSVQWIASCRWGIAASAVVKCARIQPKNLLEKGLWI